MKIYDVKILDVPKESFFTEKTENIYGGLKAYLSRHHFTQHIPKLNFQFMKRIYLQRYSITSLLI